MGEPLTPEEQARFNAMLAQQGQTGPAGPPAPSGEPSPAEVEAMMKVDARAASRGAAQAQRAPAASPVEDEAFMGQARGLAQAGVAPDEIADRLRIAPDQRDAFKRSLAGPEQSSAPTDSGGGGLQVGAAAVGAPTGGAPPAPPLQFVPGGWQAKARTGRIELPDGTEGEFLAGDALHQQAIEQNATAAIGRNDADAEQFQNISRGLRGMDNYTARQESRRQGLVEQHQLRLEQLTDNLTRMEDPAQAYAKKGTPGTLFSILGVALGGYAAGMKGGPNQALEAYERGLDRDLEVQRERIAEAKGKVADQRGLLATMRENFGDEKAAEQAAKIAYLGRAEYDLKALAAQSNNPEVKARATDMLAALQDRRAQRQIEFAKLTQGNLHEAYTPAHYVGGPGAGPKVDPEKEKLYVPTGPNSGYYARTEAEAEEGRKLEYAKQTIVPKLESLKKGREESNFLERLGAATGIYSSPRMRQIQSTQKGLAADVRRVEGIRGFGPEVEDLAKGQAGDFTTVLGDPSANANAFIGNVNTQAGAFERGQAGQGAQNTMAVDTNGRPVTVAVPQASMAGPRAEMPAGFKPVAGEAQPRFVSPQRTAAPKFVVPAKGGKGGGHRKKAEEDEE